MAKQGTVRGRKRRKEERLVRHTHLSLSLLQKPFLMLKLIVLPRQARDKHRKTSAAFSWFVQVRLLMAHYEGVISARLQTHLEQTPHLPMEVTVRESGGGCVFTQCTRLFHVMREIISRNV